MDQQTVLIVELVELPPHCYSESGLVAPTRRAYDESGVGKRHNENTSSLASQRCLAGWLR